MRLFPQCTWPLNKLLIVENRTEQPDILDIMEAAQGHELCFALSVPKIGPASEQVLDKQSLNEWMNERMVVIGHYRLTKCFHEAKSSLPQSWNVTWKQLQCLDTHSRHFGGDFLKRSKQNKIKQTNKKNHFLKSYNKIRFCKIFSILDNLLEPLIEKSLAMRRKICKIKIHAMNGRGGQGHGFFTTLQPKLWLLNDLLAVRPWESPWACLNVSILSGKMEYLINLVIARIKKD